MLAALVGLLYQKYIHGDTIALHVSVCFNVFDKDRSGYLDEVRCWSVHHLARSRRTLATFFMYFAQQEVIDLCNTVSGGNPMFPGNYVQAMQQFDV